MDVESLAIIGYNAVRRHRAQADPETVPNAGNWMPDWTELPQFLQG